MENNNTEGKISRELLMEAQEKIDYLLLLLKPCFEILQQRELWPQEEISPACMDFLVLSRERVAIFPEMFPLFMSAKDFDEKVEIVRKLWILAAKLDKLKNNLNGLITLKGNDVLETALKFYRMVRIAARRDIPAARVLFDELRPVYLSKGKKKRKTAST